ncbi:hypothetical protein GCM10011611_64240 [Aliidongia dinghuensis]|uniref:GlsB/YeaQ/YmgE family stress response membrane protein n=1 Tax=Aliidongia dinghuensis TaxID=1867774 RepID=A0A8J2Z1G0_9PROT|nr:GlsB/YeaQ/YmgE family stress response membrane protein [Aliidongia dinghuensis]GGF49005.1 hypothetical protein GCM10011611_64240 [Aliidongia dinghuensis]
MSVVVWLALGLGLGWLASLVAGNGASRPTYLTLGAIGALAGGFLFALFGGLGLTGPGIIAVVIGASLVLTLYLGIRRRA